MGNLFKSNDKPKQKQQQQQQKSQFPSQKKELSEGEKLRIKLQHQRDQLKDKRKQIELQIEQYEKQIRQLIQQEKREQAKHLVQQKMLYDKFLSNILDKELVIAQSVQRVDQLQSDKELAELISQANDVMKDLQTSIDQEKLQDALLDMQEAKQRQEEMNHLYKQYAVDNNDEVDETYGKYEQSLFPQNTSSNQQFVPLPQQQQQQQQNVVQEQQQQNNEYQEKLAMLE